ncbi:hypothetical protein, partial [Terrabacter sp. NPDC000476]|uniref:hypothetical protein n=1 Tax=Terrabacter sp. NPDC000476 TaxID=3154258 RepID=UPI00331F3984
MSQQHPPAAGAPERTKVLSVRLTQEEFAALSSRADELGIGASTLARTLVRRALVPASPHDRAASHLTALEATLRPEVDLDARLDARPQPSVDARLAVVEARAALAPRRARGPRPAARPRRRHP